MDMPKDPATKALRKRKLVQYRPRHKRLEHLEEVVTKHGFKERITVAGSKSQASEPVYCGVWGINQAETETSEMEINSGNYRIALNHLEDSVRDRRPPRKSMSSRHNNTTLYKESNFSNTCHGSTGIASTSFTSQRDIQCNTPPQLGYTTEQRLPIAFPSQHSNYDPAATENVVTPQLPLASHYVGYDLTLSPHQLGAYSRHNPTMMAMENGDAGHFRQTHYNSHPTFRPLDSSILPLENSLKQPILSGLENNIQPRFIDPHAQPYRPDPLAYCESQPNGNTWDDVNAQPPVHNYHLNFQNVDTTDYTPSETLNHYIYTLENQAFLGSHQYGGPFYQNISRTP